MQHSEDLQGSAEMLRMVVPRLSRLKIPVTPLNYALWYDYYLGANDTLVSRVDEMLESEGGWSPQEAERLFETLVLRQNMSRLDGLSDDVQQLLTRVMSLVSGAEGDVEEFGASLQVASDSLSEGGVSELGELVSSLVNRTALMVSSNQSVHAQLLSSTKEVEKLKSDLESVKREAMLDPLTGIGNRSVLNQAMLLTLQQVKEGMSAYVIMVDVDRFKQFNDRFGHLVGDKVLKFLAGTLTGTVKGRDTVARFGGEEFCIILSDISREGAVSVSEKVRRTVQEADLKRSESGESLGRVTVSLGVTRVHPNDTFECIIERADTALYASKKQGRNQVTVSDEGS